MSRRAIAILLVCVGALFVTCISGYVTSSVADDEPTTAPAIEKDRWMMVKLNSAQRILEDLTSGDFDRMEADAQRMRALNLLEQWLRDEDFERESEYQGQLNAFEFATKELVRHAADDNVDGALKSYVALTESCVRCHQLIRDQ